MRINEEISRKETTTRHLFVLLSTLPRHRVDRVARGEAANDYHGNAAVLILDIAGLTSISDRIPAGRGVILPGHVLSAFDALCETCNVNKIKMIGVSNITVSFDGITAERLA